MALIGVPAGCFVWPPLLCAVGHPPKSWPGQLVASIVAFSLDFVIGILYILAFCVLQVQRTKRVQLLWQFQ